jgi:hypothetical protein
VGGSDPRRNEQAIERRDEPQGRIRVRGGGGGGGGGVGGGARVSGEGGMPRVEAAMMGGGVAVHGHAARHQLFGGLRRRRRWERAMGWSRWATRARLSRLLAYQGASWVMAAL